MRNEIGPGWYGPLTRENIEDVAANIENMLTGKRYTFASVRISGGKPHVNVRPSQEMERIRVAHIDSIDYSQTIVRDTYGVWSCGTDGAYIVFERGRIRIEHVDAWGEPLTWIIAPERNDA